MSSIWTFQVDPRLKINVTFLQTNVQDECQEVLRTCTLSMFDSSFGFYEVLFIQTKHRPRDAGDGNMCFIGKYNIFHIVSFKQTLYIGLRYYASTETKLKVFFTVINSF